MKLNEQLQVERKKKNLTIQGLANKLSDELGYVVSADRIRRWERGETDIDIPSLRFLSKFYDVTPDDLVDENVEPTIDLEEQYYLFGKEISDCCGVDNIYDFVRVYDLVKKNEWVVTPKYDIIARAYEDYLKEDDIAICYFSCQSVYNTCKRWMLDIYEYKKEDKIYNQLYMDDAGKLRVTDKRDPVEYMKLIEELETLQFDISCFLEYECYEERDVSIWDYI